ncbi:host-nuclease inhibitor Gam family protein [Actinobacillus delphinicola]|uniref:Mu-like prophage host-nuclease inhibitor protein Gam n=1 Tax=Actinobacillus delphinicola TaxID=51161 RepID=A0A448TUW8_9PAST|nr:host-nuclease inhibitor Gam family protein [Actinobacillus delphinicola]VEJ09726.1 Mu-like prophage host-nuclease inhibitor protein Gam [Actinobacillus delphinicola]
MAKPTKVRLKKPALTETIHCREEVEVAITKIGNLQREYLRLQVQQNDEIAQITDHYAPKLLAYKEQITHLQDAVQAWCEANRAELTQNGKSKTAKFNTGNVQWRQCPPSVIARGIPTILENLKLLGLSRFIRNKEEINKEAMLLEPDLANTVNGISIKQGVEDFVITPFEQQ